MEIDLIQLKKEIEFLSNKLRNNNNHQECLYIVCCIKSLQEIYRNITGTDCDIKLPNIIRVEDVIIDNYKSNKKTIFIPCEKSVSEVYKEIFLSDKKYYSDLSRNVLNFTNPFPLKNGKKLNEKTYFELLNEFLSCYDPNLLAIFEKLKKENLIDFRRTGRDTFTANIFSLNKIYAVVDRRMDIYGLNSFVHELGHVYSYSKINSESQAYNDIFYLPEFYSSFMELMLIDFFETNNILESDTSNLKKYFLGRMRRDADSIDKIISIPEERILDYEDIFLPPMLYFESAYLSLIMNEMYMKDKEGTRERIDDYLKNQGMISRDQTLELLGTSRKEVTSGYTLKRIIK